MRACHGSVEPMVEVSRPWLERGVPNTAPCVHLATTQLRHPITHCRFAQAHLFAWIDASTRHSVDAGITGARNWLMQVETGLPISSPAGLQRSKTPTVVSNCTTSQKRQRVSRWVLENKRRPPSAIPLRIALTSCPSCRTPFCQRMSNPIFIPDKALAYHRVSDLHFPMWEIDFDV